jgi:hypothetical protein
VLMGSKNLWGLADALGIVPAPPDGRLAELLLEWWGEPRSFGCPHAAAQPWWTVVAPDRRIWCSACATERFGEEHRCFYCGEPVRQRRSAALAVEMTGQVRVVARVHPRCSNNHEGEGT